MHDPDALTILIADDSASDRLLLEAFVRGLGHRVITAADGAEAVARFHALRPDIILLDALMPAMDGFEVARQVKAAAGDAFVAIIFLTALNEADSLARCLTAGGDDFLTKPYNRIILKAKIEAFRRMLRMHATLQRQRDEIAGYNKTLLREQELAKRIFDKVARPGYFQASNLRYSLSPLAMFNGDILLVAWLPSGNMLALLGDFTGHGLAAAVGAMPLAQTFYSMADKGFALSDIVRELNSRLYEVLPTGVFCCACLVELNFDDRSLQVWNGGLPDALLVRADGSLEGLPSLHLPLGIQDGRQFDASTRLLPMRQGDRVFLRSDGIHETRNAAGQAFGEERLLALMQAPPVEALFDRVLAAVEDFSAGARRTDDVSLVELCMVDRAVLQGTAGLPAVENLQGAADWSMEYVLRMDSIRNFDPLPLLLHVLMEVPGLRSHAGDVYAILSELYANAVEHGIAGLDSDIKSSHEGFVHYYALKRQRLQALQEGHIRIGLQYRGDDSQGCLQVRVEDSGAGFQAPPELLPAADAVRFAGRGLPLVRSLCRSLRVLPPGNCVEAVYDWSYKTTRTRKFGHD